MEDSLNTVSENVIITKECITCHKELPIDMFSIRRSRSNKADAHWIYSRYGECKECNRKRKAKWRIENPNYMKDWYIKHMQNKKT